MDEARSDHVSYKKTVGGYAEKNHAAQTLFQNHSQRDHSGVRCQSQDLLLSFSGYLRTAQVGIDEEAIQVVRHFDLLENYEDAIRFGMDYVRKNDYIISCTHDSIGREEMKRFFYMDFIEIVTSVIEGGRGANWHNTRP